MEVTLGCLGTSVTGWGWGFGFVVVVLVTLTTRLPRTTWYHPSPKFTSSAEGPARLAFVAAGRPVAALFRGRFGACSARTAFAFLNTAAVVRFVVTTAVPALRLLNRSRTSPRNSGNRHTRLTGACIRCYAEYFRNDCGAFIAVGFLAPRTFPPTLVGRRVR